IQTHLRAMPAHKPTKKFNARAAKTSFPASAFPFLTAALDEVADGELDVAVLLEVPLEVPLLFEPGVLLSSSGSTFNFNPEICWPLTLYTARETVVEDNATSFPCGLFEIPLLIIASTPAGRAGMLKPSSKPLVVMSDRWQVGGWSIVAVALLDIRAVMLSVSYWPCKFR